MKNVLYTGGSDFHSEQDKHNLFDSFPARNCYTKFKDLKEYQCPRHQGKINRNEFPATYRILMVRYSNYICIWQYVYTFYL